MDPKFEYGIALAQTCGRAMLRLANADILPFELDRFVNRIKSDLDEITKLTEELRKETEKENRLIEGEIYKIASDPTANIKLPQKKDVVPEYDFSSLQNVLTEMQSNLAAYQKTKEKLRRSGKSLAKNQKKELDQIYYKAERTLIQEEGLPGRLWYKHYIYAPGSYTGYGSKTLPTIREALEQRNWEEVKIQIPLVVEVLEGFANQIQKATNIYADAGN